MKIKNNCFTTNQTLTLQNFTWGGGRNTLQFLI